MELCDELEEDDTLDTSEPWLNDTNMRGAGDSGEKFADSRTKSLPRLSASRFVQ